MNRFWSPFSIPCPVNRSVSHAESQPRVTLKTIARHLGLSTAAVSMALRHRPNIPAETVVRVERAAVELGYRPDAELGRLMARLKQGRSTRFSGSLALINLFPSPRLADHNPQLARIARGITERAASQGYSIDEFCLGPGRPRPARVAQMLRARGIEGIILPGGPQYIEKLDLPFQHFATALVGTSIGLPLHRASPHQFFDMLTVVEKLALKGYRAPGLVLRHDTDLRVRHQHSAAFGWAQTEYSQWRRVPILRAPEITRDPFLRWLRQHNPDVVIAQSPTAATYLSWLAYAGKKVPDEVAFVSLDADPTDLHVSGIIETKEEYAAAAVDLVIAQLQRNERGQPASPKLVQLQSRWQEGQTAR